MKRIAIIGTGQLAQMMALASKHLEVSFVFVAEQGDSVTCVQDLGQVVVREPNWSSQELYERLGCPDVITVEKEAVSVTLLEQLSEYCDVAPPPKAVAVTQNREREKAYLQALGIPTVANASASTLACLDQAVQRIPFPMIIKASESGYDGKHQWRLETQADYAAFRKTFALAPQPVVLEQWVSFSAEVSLIGVRAAGGQPVYYPLTENVHRNGILLTSRVPVSADLSGFEVTARSYMDSLFSALNYVGVLAMECFVVGDQLLVNELAPRVHNSGHWTQEGCRTSQFENHIRAIAGLTLGATDLLGQVAMLNLLGLPRSRVDCPQSECTLHWYGKSTQAGRKMGHVNILSQSPQAVETLLAKLEAQFYGTSQ